MNSWKVLWTENGRRLFKKFPADSPKEAVEFGKSLKKRGCEVLGIISMKVAYAPPKSKAKPDIYGIMWCPYCVKWRVYDMMGKWSGGTLLPEELRCPICTVSINDYWVRHYNPLIAARYLHLEGPKNGKAG